MSTHDKVDLIADLSEAILEDPSSALTSSRTPISVSTKPSRNADGGDEEKDKHYQKTQSKMNKLLGLASLPSNGHDVHAARLALLSLLAIFQDILPSYRIRLPTDAEMAVRVSKEVKQQWDFERKLLQAYQRYLQLLEKTWEDGKFGRKWALDGKKKGSQSGLPPTAPTAIAATAILALSQLLQTCYNFNFRSNLLQIIVRQANNKNEDIRTACCQALRAMFVKDIQGDASLEAVRLMAKLIKQLSTNSGSKPINPDLVNTWLSLPLRVHEDEAMAAKLATQAKAKRAKKSQANKEQAEIEKEMKEGEATVDKLELAKNQNECLHSITLTYFRILKVVAGQESDDCTSGTVTNALLPCALRGLASFSHLINLDAVVDLLKVLKDVLRNVSNLSPDAAILCILCALKTLRGSGNQSVLPVDPKEYLIPLYGLLPRLGIQKVGSGESADKTIEAAIQCLDHAFLQRRELSTTRLAGFIKRLTSTSLHAPPHSCVPLLASARHISARYSAGSSKINSMLENEEEIIAEGMYAPGAEDPEHSNAHATSLWELSLMRYSIHPIVNAHASAMAEGRLLKLPGEAPQKIWNRCSRDASELRIPQKAQWKKHPLATTSRGLDGSEGKRGVEFLLAERKRRKRQRQNQIRFITPRRTAEYHLLPPTSYSML